MDIPNSSKIETFTITGDWKKQSTTLKETFPQLTDADLKFVPGKEQDLLTRVQNRLGKERHETLEIIKSLQPTMTVSAGVPKA